MDRFKNHFPFSWSSSSLPYLGVHLTSKILLLHHHNYPPMLKRLSEDLSQWPLYKMSWLGRVNAVKMTLLPRILYLFCSLPIPITKCLLDKLQSAIIRFILGGKGHRLSKNVLYRSRKKRRFRTIQLMVVLSGRPTLPIFSHLLQRPETRLGGHRKTGNPQPHSRLSNLEPTKRSAPNFIPHIITLNDPM